MDESSPESPDNTPPVADHIRRVFEKLGLGTEEQRRSMVTDTRESEPALYVTRVSSMTTPNMPNRLPTG